MDWGLGHATRCVPIIELLQQAGANVIIGADRRPLEFLKLRFPKCQWIKLPGYQPEYQKRGPVTLKVATEIPKILKASKPAHDLLESLIPKLHIHALISDNRYELWSKQVPTIFITHQLSILTRGIFVTSRPVLKKIIFSYIKKHNELWIPDFAGENNLSGKLSHIGSMPLKDTYFIGTLSRFESLENRLLSKPKIDVLCLLSGPEPQRTILEELLIKQLLSTDYKTVILSGKPGETNIRKIKNIEIRSHASDAEMAKLIQSAKTVVSRSGYSTLMDIVSLGSKAVFIPTPGQPEQEYLSKRLMKKHLYFSTTQKNFQIKEAIIKANTFSGLKITNDYKILKTRIKTLSGDKPNNSTRF